MELLLISLLSALGGAGIFAYYDEDVVCKEILLTTNKELLKPIEIVDCKQDDAQTDCNIPYPRYVLSTEEYKKDIANGIETRVNLKQCVDAVDRYNKDKFIER